MTPRHRVSRAAIVLIKRFEGYRRTAAELPDGRWMIGHGHTQTARKGAQVSEDDAEALLLYDLIAVAHGVNESVFSPLTQNQFDALASFTFNIGLDNFRRSGVLKRLNEGAAIQAACAMELWRKAEVGGERIVVDALVRRRSAEKALFLTPDGGEWIPAPSPILRPLLDSDAGALIPAQVPAPVTASMDGEQVVILRDDQPVPHVAPLDDDAEGPARAAAESVTARLQTIFPDAGAEADAPEAEAEQEDDPFILNAPLEVAEEPAAPASAFPDVEFDEPRGPDLFDRPFNEPLAEPQASAVAKDDEDAPEPLAITDEPFEFLRPMAQPLPEEPRAGLIGLLTLAVIGLAFFAGGIFWATNAGSAAQDGLLDPRLVGWLAGAAGVGFFVVAAYLLLERLGRASERTARQR